MELATRADFVTPLPASRPDFAAPVIPALTPDAGPPGWLTTPPPHRYKRSRVRPVRAKVSGA